MTGSALRRIIETRWRIERQSWAARVPVLRHQLRAMRGTYPS